MIKIKEYKEYILAHKFYEAHEILEEFWFPRRKQKDDLTLIIKGFINAAVSFELRKRGRQESSKRVWQTYIKLTHNKLDGFNDLELIELKKFIDNFEKSYLP